MAQVSELLVITSPSCGGKTRFLDRAYAGRHGDLLARLGVQGSIRSYKQVLVRELPEYRGAVLPRMVLHVALPVMALVQKKLQRIADERAFDFIAGCGSVTSITLVASAAVLQSRLQSRYRRAPRLLLRSIPEYLAVRSRLKQLMQVYEDPDNLALAYDAWLAYVGSLPNVANSWLVTSLDEYELHEPTEWPRVRQAYFGSSPGPGPADDVQQDEVQQVGI